MTRSFADLHLRINPKDQHAAQRINHKAAQIGYRTISIPFTNDMHENEVAVLKAICAQAGIDFVLRADFNPEPREDLTRFLRKFRRRFEVICISCDSKEVARQAAKDRRVDLLNFPSLDYHKRFFDRAEAELASGSLAALEVDVKPLLVMEGPSRVRLLMSLRREIGIALEFNVPIVVSSGVGEQRFYAVAERLGKFRLLVWDE